MIGSSTNRYSSLQWFFKSFWLLLLFSGLISCDPEKGAKLSYYASWWIRSYILKFILDNFKLVKIGTTSEQKKLFFNLLKEKERLTKMGVEPEYKIISENLGVSEKSVALMDQRLSSSGQEISIENLNI